MTRKPEPILMSRHEVMRELGISSTTLWKLCRDGQLRAYKVRGKTVFRRTEFLEDLDHILIPMNDKEG